MPDDVIVLGKECRVITLKREAAGKYLSSVCGKERGVHDDELGKDCQSHGHVDGQMGKDIPQTAE